jgi:hypothetical protein
MHPAWCRAMRLALLTTFASAPLVAATVLVASGSGCGSNADSNDASVSDSAADGQDVNSPDAGGDGGMCPDFNPNKNVYWGDLHTHTALSGDAYGWGNRNFPHDAYRFASDPTATTPIAAGAAHARAPRVDRSRARLGRRHRSQRVARCDVGLRGLPGRRRVQSVEPVPRLDAVPELPRDRGDGRRPDPRRCRPGHRPRVRRRPGENNPTCALVHRSPRGSSRSRRRTTRISLALSRRSSPTSGPRPSPERPSTRTSSSRPSRSHRPHSTRPSTRRRATSGPVSIRRASPTPAVRCSPSRTTAT